MLLRHTPAACTPLQRQSHAHPPANASCTAAISYQRSQLSRTSRTSRGAGYSVICSRMVAKSTTAPSPLGPSAAAAMATAATLHCQLRRRQRSPLSPHLRARGKRTTAAQQLCRSLVDATALPLSAPQQHHQPGELALAAPVCMHASRHLTRVVIHDRLLRESATSGLTRHLHVTAELRVLPMASAVVVRTAEPSDYWAIAVSELSVLMISTSAVPV